MMKKGLVCAILVLFVGISMMPIAGSISIERVSTDNQMQKSYLGDDTTPPVTTISFDPPYPDGDNGWYVSDVTVTLNATDDISGVDTTYYSINSEPWEVYDEPFLLNWDGLYHIVYFSVDNAGNMEFPKLLRLKIDQTPPTIDLTWEVSGDDLIFTATCSDATSGMDRVEFAINDVVMFVDDMEPYVWIMYYLWPNYIYKATAFDNAGNSAFVTVNDSDIESYPNSQSRQQSSTGSTVVKKATMPTSYDGNTLYVGGSGPNNYSRIQAAINDADWYDTVFVYDNSSPYVENIEIDKPINLIGENKETTIIDGGKNDHVVYLCFGADGVKISNFTIRNSGHGAWPVDYWGIVIEVSSYCVITENIIQDNEGTIWDSGMNTIISNNIVRNNSYGLALEGVNSIISQNLIENNNYPGVVVLDAAKNNVISNNIIKNNGGIQYNPYEREGKWCYSGILLHGGKNNVYQNNITNSHYGIIVGQWSKSSDNNVYQNNIINNTIGILVKRGKENRFYQNNFFGNKLYNALDLGDNHWDNGSVGNYWSDYKIRGGYDDDGDGIGDIPYKIWPYLLGNKDNYPLMKPHGNITSVHRNQNQAGQQFQNNQQCINQQSAYNQNIRDGQLFQQMVKATRTTNR